MSLDDTKVRPAAALCDTIILGILVSSKFPFPGVGPGFSRQHQIAEATSAACSSAQLRDVIMPAILASYFLFWDLMSLDDTECGLKRKRSFKCVLLTYDGVYLS